MPLTEQGLSLGNECEAIDQEAPLLFYCGLTQQRTIVTRKQLWTQREASFIVSCWLSSRTQWNTQCNLRQPSLRTKVNHPCSIPGSREAGTSTMEPVLPFLSLHPLPAIVSWPLGKARLTWSS